MTINNCNFNSHPIANPLNSRFYGNNNCMWNNSGFKRCPSETKVPYSQPLSNKELNFQDNVHVPQNNSIPMGMENQMLTMPEYNQDIFQCPDGTLISKSSGKILKDNSRTFEFPYGKMKMINTSSSHSEWNNAEIMDFNPEHMEESGLGLSKSDIEYAEISRRKNEYLKNNMNNLQKQLLQDLEDGEIC